MRALSLILTAFLVPGGLATSLLNLVPRTLAICACDADVNNDGFVNIIDWVCVQNCKGGDCSCCLSSCDINCDGVVDNIDAGDDPQNVQFEGSMFSCQFTGFPATACCGSCCDTFFGVCTSNVFAADCEDPDEAWAQGLLCPEVDCDPAPTGACCTVATGVCQNDRIEAQCTGANVSWTQGAQCSPALCPSPPTGACCDLAFGTCQNSLTQAACGAGFWTEGAACSPATCPAPPTGACCNLGNGLCTDGVIEANCSGANFVWTQATLCSSVSCSVPPQNPCTCDADINNDGIVNLIDWACVQDCRAGDCACCLSSCDVNCDGVVNDVDAGDHPLDDPSMFRCQFVGFPATVCCGSCCNELTGVCADDVVSADCDGANDAWAQGLRCSEFTCSAEPTGACCNLPFGTCQNNVIEGNCAGAGLVWTEATACSPALCPAPPAGACCNSQNGHCHDDIIEAECVANGRTWTVSTVCSSVNCAVPPQDPCPCNGEINGVAPINIVDVLAVLDCANEDCSDCSNSCDADCDGYVDLVDMGIVACRFQGGSDCCSRPSGACLGAQALPSCAVTLEAGCNLLQGTYLGDSSSCTGVGGPIPATSTWALVWFLLALMTAATLVIQTSQRCRRARCSP